MMKKGRLIIFSGPSGVGKSTLRKELFKRGNLNLRYSISMTTRPIRVGEENHVDYHFVNEEEFLQALKEDRFLEHAQFINNYYGTLEKDVDDLLDEGYNVMLEIEVKGAKQVLDKRPDALGIFIVPPSFDELRQRIVNRKSESEDVINKRLNMANEEMKFKDTYDYVVINDKLENAVEEVSKIILKECPSC